ncbi:hypothetical protein OH492_17800 [Vibrio chagasii]|nr:hypothetical protein [Vibrio chagasii]
MASLSRQMLTSMATFDLNFDITDGDATLQATAFDLTIKQLMTYQQSVEPVDKGPAALPS